MSGSSIYAVLRGAATLDGFCQKICLPLALSNRSEGAKSARVGRGVREVSHFENRKAHVGNMFRAKKNCNEAEFLKFV